MSGNLLVTAIGTIALVAGSFLQWIELGLASGLTRTGFDLEIGVYFNWDEVGLADSFLLSAGIVTVGLGVLALVGAARARWGVTRVAGILATAAAILLWLSLANTSDMNFGYWIIAAGALLVILGSFLGSKRPVSA